jgi:indole-3-glycerol phosphate synthase
MSGAAPVNILTEIVAHKRIEVAARKADVPEPRLHERIANAAPPRGFARAIERTIAAGRAAVIAECKKASPSKGEIRKDYDPAAIARAYAAAGASCLSVLTDERYFGGNAADLVTARAACALPVLRKDFIIDPYQIAESRAMGADCILLIVACLRDAELLDLNLRARDFDLDVLVEVHDRAELERAHRLQTPLIGINNRDLNSFTTDIEVTLRLAADVLPDRTIISESGIHSPDQVKRLRTRGINAFLVGEAFMSFPDPGRRLQDLFPDNLGAE